MSCTDDRSWHTEAAITLEERRVQNAETYYASLDAGLPDF